MDEKDKKDMKEKLEKQFGGPTGILAHLILTLSTSGQPCDVAFHKKKPALNVKMDPKITIALMYGAGAKKIQEILRNIELSNGDTISIDDIWMVFPMPANGFSKEELEEVDLAAGEEKWGPKGETIREMIRNLYHCESKEEEEKYLRRYLAS
ncbi:MAG: hypothetical protein WCD43_09705 [Candidatus Acidiferrales bacterium]